MNWDEMTGIWHEAKGKAKERWGKLTDDDLQAVEGKRDQLIGRLQQRYGIAREEAERQADEFYQEYKRSHGRDVRKSGGF